MTILSRLMHVEAIRFEAEGVLSFELVAPHDTLPPVEAGAHIDVRLPGGISRSYSLCNAPGEVHRYAIGVARDPASRGGSAYLHEQLRVGSTLEVSGPRSLCRS